MFFIILFRWIFPIRYLREVLRDGAADEDVEAVAKEEAPRKRSVSSASADKGKIKSRRSEAQLETVQDGIENVPRKKSLTSDTSSTRRRKSQNQILDVPVSSSSIILSKFLELFAAFMNRVADEEEQRLLREMEFIERAKKLQVSRAGIFTLRSRYPLGNYFCLLICSWYLGGSESLSPAQESESAHQHCGGDSGLCGQRPTHLGDSYTYNDL